MGSSLAKRPIEPLIRALRKWGAKIEWSPSYGITVRGGKLDGGITEIPGNISSQFISALLLVAPLTERRSIIRVTSPLESRSYVLMTLECLRSFGIQIETSDALNEFQSTSQAYQTSNYKVEGDWSSASYLIALGAAGGEIKLSGLNLSSLQSDRIMLDLVKEMGARLIVEGNCLIVKTGRLRAIKADLNECIDLLPTLAVLASLAEGTSEFTGIRRARLKESDRVLAISTNLQNSGIKVKIEDNRICITGGKTSSAVINPYGDHRIAMAFSIVGAAKGGILIENAECVSKTYPDFWTVLKNSGVIIHEQ
jgi:3-phosphoshikimate 1-carboxyvinyltransferase